MRFIVAVLALSAVACNQERLAILEKENHELTVKLQKANLDLQEKCAQAAAAYIRSDRADRDTVSLTYSNHYNLRLNHCFIQSKSSLLSNLYTQVSSYVTDAYEGTLVANVSEITLKNEAPQITCSIAGRACHSRKEFDESIKQFMEN